jgi:NhaP-type Na+/H+ or K+/H+ antiporter
MLSDVAPDPYILLLTGLGVLIALVAWLPMALKRLPLSLPIICIGIGAAGFLLPQVTLRPLPVRYPEVTERFAEFVVIITAMGAGLKIDRLFGWRRWGITWRLLAITMPLGIVAITVLGQTMLGLPLAVALLLAASLAPTDPVLAADVQVGPPKTGDEDDARFGLTSEAGLNDSAAFPFVHLAIILAVALPRGEPWLMEWLSYRVLWGDRRRYRGWLGRWSDIRVANLSRAIQGQACPYGRRVDRAVRNARLLWPDRDCARVRVSGRIRDGSDASQCPPRAQVPA